MHRYPLSILFLRQIVIAPELHISPEHQEHKATQSRHRHHAANCTTRATISECLLVCGS